ncbi:DEAD/DEAH box helicase family protein [Macrococcus equipercicus]|uniref:DEAD/DEAH box helicase n=1 Tax=Macrococcus equipercicus TaxID=69967 RepID=A0A9Q9F1U6_9STAP|nr:DEAD/DEAH box helicase family protein [Macrococcus equipercicus]KAA1042451.1 DEAD/DEAH box helicase [Macrococcus equipercicus]UTH14337.1 DEAD/DEAH box helicase family protein [Macrococcus equipercicus]
MALLETSCSGMPGVIKAQGYHCSYCLNEDQRLFYTYFNHQFQKEITYCRVCIMMTWSTTETYYQPVAIPDAPEQLECHLDFALTAQQNYASRLIVEAVESGGRRLLHAVTGAGKTEMILKGIQTARRLGRNVAIVSPRVDVVKEVYLRMAAYFDADIDVLYEGQSLAYSSRFVICTVPQLYRYMHHFGLLIVDEVDAFPLPMDERLMRCVARAAAADGTMIYLTATPPRALRAAFEKHEVITLPARYHERPLPVPRFKYLSVKSILKGRLAARLERRHSGTLLVFFNDIQVMTAAAVTYQSFKPLTVFAADRSRHDKVEEIRAGKHRIVFTTTILERGFTLAGLDVWVVDSGSFTAECLIQMAGRVDRKREYYDGEVIFFHDGVTLSMQRAVKEIQTMNQTAKRRGWIK